MNKMPAITLDLNEYSMPPINTAIRASIFNPGEVGKLCIIDQDVPSSIKVPSLIGMISEMIIKK